MRIAQNYKIILYGDLVYWTIWKVLIRKLTIFYLLATNKSEVWKKIVLNHFDFITSVTIIKKMYRNLIFTRLRTSMCSLIILFDDMSHLSVLMIVKIILCWKVVTVIYFVKKIFSKCVRIANLNIQCSCGACHGHCYGSACMVRDQR